MRLYLIVASFLLFCLVQTRRRSAGISMPRGRKFRGMSNLGQSLSNFWKNGVEQQEDDVVKSGKQMNAQVNKMKLHDQMLDNRSSYLTLIILSLTGVAGIICFLRCKRPDEEADIDYNRIRQRRHQRQKRNRVLQQIDKHGVHPDRATGDIYRIRL